MAQASHSVCGGGVGSVSLSYIPGLFDGVRTSGRPGLLVFSELWMVHTVETSLR